MTLIWEIKLLKKSIQVPFSFSFFFYQNKNNVNILRTRQDNVWV